MPPDRSEKTLVYRVQLDESSVAQSIRTARETVGVGLSQAVDQAANVGQAVNMTAATAMARVGSHLEFMERTRQVLAQPDEANLAPHGLGTLRALGVVTGMVGPRFSESQGSLEGRANAELGDPTGLKGLQRTGTAANAALTAAGIGIMFIPGGQVVGAALTLSQIAASQGVSTGFDRAINRRMMAGSLRQLGMAGGLQVGRDFEDVINQLDVRQQDAFEVGAAALSSVQRGSIKTRSQARDVVVGALTDWKMTGSLLEMEKGDALAFQGELWRMGITPGTTGTLMGNISALKGWGMNPAAMSAMTLDVMRQASVGGYDAMAAGNNFALQTGMIQQMMRTSVLSRADLTAAAGFSGPQAEQAAAASQRITSEMLQIRESGIGRAITAGLMNGGSGDFSSLISSAGRMSVQQMAEFDVNRSSANMLPQEQQALLGVVRTTLKQSGIDPTQTAVQGQLMRMGMSSGVARVLSRTTPEAIGIQQASAERMQADAWSEKNHRENAVYSSLASVGSGMGDAAENAYSGEDSGYISGAAMVTGHMAGIGSAVPAITGIASGIESARGRRYKGVRGMGDFAHDVFDMTVGNQFRKAWSSWEFSAKDANLFGIIRTGMGTRAERSTITKRELRSMSGAESRERFQAMDEFTAEYRKKYGDEPFSLQRAEELALDRETQAMTGFLSDGDNRLRVHGDVTKIRDTFGIKVTDDQMMNLLVEKERYKGMLDKAGTKEERSAIMSEFEGHLQSMGFIPKDIDPTKLADHLLNRTNTVIDTETKKKLISAKQIQAMEGEFVKNFGTKEKRAEIAKKVFKEGSGDAQAFIDDDKITARGFKDLITHAEAHGNLNREYAAGAMGMTKGDMSLSAAVRRRVLVDNAVDLSKSEEAKKEKDSETPEKDGEGGVPAGLVKELRDLNSNLKNMINSGMIKGKE